MNNTVTILPEGCAMFAHVVSLFCLPKKASCDDTVVNGVFEECGKQYNCNLSCSGDTPYFIPVPEDGTMMFQTNFHRVDNTTGWGDWISIDLTNEKGISIGDVTDLATRKITGRSGKFSYQTIEIDFSTIEYECFGFKIHTLDGDEICTQIFKKRPCATLVEIEGVFDDYDCWNNYYGDPVGNFSGTSFKYSNKIYIEGSVKYYGGTIDMEEDTIKEFTRVHAGAKIASFMMKYLLNKVLPAETVIVNGESYKNEASGNFTPLNSSSMFFPILEFYQLCGSTNASCN